MDEKEKEFKRKALGVVDHEKMTSLMQGPFRPDRAILSQPLPSPYAIRSFCTRCNDYALITERGLELAMFLLELRERKSEILTDTDGYYLEFEICPNCSPKEDRMEFIFRRISELEKSSPQQD